MQYVMMERVKTRMLSSSAMAVILQFIKVRSIPVVNSRAQTVTVYRTSLKVNGSVGNAPSHQRTPWYV